MDKMKMQTSNIVDENVGFIESRFPNCIVEARDEDGNLKKMVDFDMLKQELSKVVVDGDKERYQMTWPDKRKAILTANAPINATLRPCREESVDFDNTKNLYIEGDNLDVLKLLRETYLGKVKMIYIDPPYNTGNDFVYNDDFAESTEKYVANSGQFDDQGNRLVQNTESNGRFHTDWLNMIYPRLKVAKDLLTDDGVIFISMADNELGNQLKVCEDVFGKNNIEIFVWKKKGGAGNTERILGVLTEYIVCCFKNKKPNDFNYQFFNRTYKYQDEKGFYNLEGIEKTNLGAYERKTMQFPIIDPATGQEFFPSKDMRWTLGETTVKELIADGKIYFDYKANKVKRIKREADYEQSQNVFYNLLDDEGSLAVAKDECGALLNNREIFDTPKPVALIKKLLLIASKKDSIVLDFFSGSATSAHATMQLNAEDGGNRRFIMVQLPEICSDDSEAYNAGYDNICEIGKERIRRAGKKIKEETGKNIDYGFRVFKLDSSNMKDTYYSPSEYDMSLLDTLDENIKPDRSPEDLLFQVMLDLGLMLDSRIEAKQINGKKVFIVGEYNEAVHPDLVCCFDSDVSNDTVTEIAKMKPKYAVFRDSSMSSDSVAVNFDQIFETYSPSTTRKVL